MTDTLPIGIVKSVLSGDTIVVRGRPINGPPPERILSLAWISAPRISKADQEVPKLYLKKLIFLVLFILVS